MKNYDYQNTLIGKKQLRQLLSFSFTNYDSMQSCYLADELKYLGFKYATQAGISISLEDLRVPFVKTLMLEKANQDIINTEKVYLKGKITDIEKFQKLINTWNLTSESLKDQIIYYFKNYDPLNSVYIMAFSGARGNLSQVRQLVGMRGLMSDPSGEIMNLPIKKNFREGLTITDYLMSGYGARKGIVDTALKTANSGYLTRRLIDVSQDILIRESNCFTKHSFLFHLLENENQNFLSKIKGRVLNKSVVDYTTNNLIAKSETQITDQILDKFEKNKIKQLYIRSPLTCNLYRAICQKCYGWDLATENLVDIGEAVGILAGQSIGEPGTQLTMRTFHTGGIFTSETRKQVNSPENGIIQFYKSLKTSILRTNRGEDVLLTKNAGSLILIPENKKKDLIKINISRNTILFPKNSQYVLKDQVLGELLNFNKPVRIEIKPMISKTAGEIFIPKLKKKLNSLSNNKLIWILAGQLYNSPLNSFLNFYLDYKINPNSFIFRTKVVNYFNGYIQWINSKNSLYEQILTLKDKRYLFLKTKLFKLKKSIGNSKLLLNIQNSKYLLKTTDFSSTIQIKLTKNKQFGILLSNSFKTLTGGTLYYNYKNYRYKSKIKYYKPRFIKKPSFCLSRYRTLIWLQEEIYYTKCEVKDLFVEHANFISKNFEIIPGIFSKTHGFIEVHQINSKLRTITLKSGNIYTGKKFDKQNKKLYYPGEALFSNIVNKELSFCEQLGGKNKNKLLVKPIILYEFPYRIRKAENLSTNSYSTLSFQKKDIFLYQSSQTIKTHQSFNLISTILLIDLNLSLRNRITLELENNKNNLSVSLYFIERQNFNNYILPHLKYRNLLSCLLVQKTQFISNYSTLGYIESISKNSLEIVQFKIKNLKNKKILLISNNDCWTIAKKEIEKYKLTDFVVNPKNIKQIGKVIVENKKIVTIQKGQPYFFPNCKYENFSSKTILQYKFISSARVQENFQKNKKISYCYYDITKLFIVQHLKSFKQNKKFDLTRFFIKKNDRLYGSLVPQFLKKVKISEKSLLLNNFITNIKVKSNFNKFEQTLLLKNLSLLRNKLKNKTKSNFELSLVNFVEHPLVKSTKKIGFYAITEDFFEQDINNIFCKNSQFIESGKTLGLLNLEKEITGDIVQGLPRIEEILEARKKNILIKRIATSKKKGLLVQNTNLDSNFEFKKVGNTIQETDNINPHKLLKAYFYYYGFTKIFFCDQKKIMKYIRLINNYEATYKSFKIIQIFILKSVQLIYESQGVTINSKHLEVIIKQMTTKVLITYEGDTPLLIRESIDLYHIYYINQILKQEQKKIACYVPLLLGISKASLNNPSFISAASFQETTKVLTKVAIEGRIDWLKGLKENIITGHLIPSGTGSQTYRDCFKKTLKFPSFPKSNLAKITSNEI